MTITILALILATGILTVTAVDNCPNQNTIALIASCCELQPKQFFTFSRNFNFHSGIYVLKDFCGDKSEIADAYCDNCNGGGGWLVVQRRQDGSVDFNRTWVEYEDGFGNLTGEFWYGLKALHCLTGQSGSWEMRMDIKLPNGTDIFLQYEQFKVASAKNMYKLTVKGFQGTTTDPMAHHNGMYFSTKDVDNDMKAKVNCALVWGLSRPSGGWWHNIHCWYINPNHYYHHYGTVVLNNKWFGLPFIEMKIRPHNCNT